jgi:hypothetical protein
MKMAKIWKILSKSGSLIGRTEGTKAGAKKWADSHFIYGKIVEDKNFKWRK